MADNALIKLDAVTKNYSLGVKLHGKNAVISAVSDVSLTVNRGEILGVVGLNGSGKTTLLKLITGLIRPTAGSVYINGKNIEQDKTALGKIGAIIEHPAFFDKLSAYENLEYISTARGDYTKERITAILELLDLTHRASASVSGFSQGMRQRLAIAAAIMSEPEIVIFDEPINGLDPDWVIKFRELLMELKSLNVCVLLSSHILSEVENVCDRIVILNNGKIVLDKPIGELGDVAGDKNESYALFLLDDIEKGREVVAALGYKCSVTDGKLSVTTGEASIPNINKELVLAGLMVKSIDIKKNSLEDVFGLVTSKQNGADPFKNEVKL